MTRINSILLGGVLMLLASCSTTQKVAKTVPVETRDLPEIVVAAPKDEPEPTEPENFTLPSYNQSYKRTHDLLHTKLDLRFDWKKQHVLGKAFLDFSPVFYASDKLRLDAKNFVIHSITLGGKSLKYEYNGEEIFIELDKAYKRGEKFTLAIDYTARPNERKAGGSAAITSDKGLYFINPLGEEPEKPTQIWTQGETESNSCWFPTVDKPNERATQEIAVTVEDKFKVLSNGALASSKKNQDGTRTDVFKMEQPHAPYLAMLAIGDYAVVTEKWRDIPLEYWVEPKFKDDAKAIFSNTSEMMSFFSDKLGVKYPWNKYAQVVVRDYVSGAMENTTASIFGEYVQKHERDLIDDNNERVVAHELFHHWFGDYVTCESWSNLTMNEGFANYSEYLWFEHKYGREAADHHRMNEVQGYMGSVRQGGAHPLIHFGFGNREEMFDAHSYNKGGAVLHMLRKYVGDEAFFASLNKYLNDNKYQAVEAHNLRLAFEAVTGEDLNWFFNQWFFEQGHPQLKITKSYDASKKQLSVTVAQVQEAKENPAIFVLPFDIDIYTAAGTKPIRKSVTLKEREQTFIFSDINTAPKTVIVDAERMLLAEIEYELSEEEAIFQYANAPLMMDRFEALQTLGESKNPAAIATIEQAINDKFWYLRSLALNTVDMSKASNLEQVAKLAENDPHAEVRATAISKLGESGLKQYVPIMEKAINSARAYKVVASALAALAKLDKNTALAYSQKLENEDSNELIIGLANMYAESNDAKYLAYFEKNLMKVDGFAAINFMDSYAKLINGSKTEPVAAVAKLKTLALDMNASPFKRFGAARSINGLRMSAKNGNNQAAFNALNTMIEEIKKAETNEQLLQMYSQF